MGILNTLASFRDSTMVAVGDAATSSFWSIAIKDHAMASHKLVTESTLKPTGFTETDDEETAAIRTVIDETEINWGGSLSGGGHAGGRFGSHFDPCEKSAHSDLQRKTGESATTSAKKTIATADALGAVPKPRYQNRQPPDGVAVVSGALELKVIRNKTKKKQKTAGATGSGNTNCAGYDFQVPFDPSCYNSFEFGGPTWAFDPYNMYFMLNMPSSSYPMGLHNFNGFSNLPLHAPGMQGYPASHYSREFQPTLHRDRKASAHARQAESSKGTGTQPHKSDGCTLTHEGGRSRSRSRSVLKRRDSSFESHDYDKEFHSRKRARSARSPKNVDHSRSRKSRSRHSYRRHAYEDSTSSGVESNFKRGW